MGMTCLFCTLVPLASFLCPHTFLYSFLVFHQSRAYRGECVKLRPTQAKRFETGSRTSCELRSAMGMEANSRLNESASPGTGVFHALTATLR